MLIFHKLPFLGIDIQFSTGYNKSKVEQNGTNPNFYIKEENMMKSTGITRQIDELGRFVLPIEIRRALDLKEKDALEIFTDEGRIILQKYQPACSFCSNADDIVLFAGKRICKSCLAELKKL